MNYKEKQYVVYNGTEICLMGGIVKRSFCGAGEHDYCVLYPNDTNTRYYIPAEKIESNIRPLLTKEQLLESVRYINEEESEWISDHNARKNVFSKVLRSGDYRKILPLMNCVMHEIIKREKSGKSVLREDRNYFETAKKIFNNEVAFVFNLNESEVEDFVKNEMMDKKT